jgi:hypothetical protein
METQDRGRRRKLDSLCGKERHPIAVFTTMGRSRCSATRQTNAEVLHHGHAAGPEGADAAITRSGTTSRSTTERTQSLFTGLLQPIHVILILLAALLLLGIRLATSDAPAQHDDPSPR